MSGKHYLKPLSKYSKKNAKKENKFSSFSPDEDLLLIDYEAFGVPATASVYVASLKRDFKKSKKSDAEFIYYAKSGRLFFNENGVVKGFGKGGVVGLFQKSASLNSSNFLFSDEVPPPPEPVTTLEPITPPEPITLPEPVTPAPPTAPTDGLFANGPRPPQLSVQDFSGAISVGGEVDRFPVSSSTGDVVKLSVDAAEDTNPLVRLVDAGGRVLDPAVAYNGNSASTSGYRAKSDAMFAEVYAQHSFTGSYTLQVEGYEADVALRSIPQDLLIVLDQEVMDTADHYASLYLYSDDGLIYVSFGSGLTAETKRWWEDVLAATDGLIEPEFVIVPQDHPKSQLVLNQTSASEVSDGAAGIYQSPSTTWSELADESRYNYRRVEQQGTINLSAGAYTQASRYAGSREAGWKSTAFHELGHALGLEHPHDDSDGDVDADIDTNGTVMSYVKEQDADGDPGYTDLDIRALQFVYGSESGVSTPSPLVDSPLLIESREFDLSQRWKAPELLAEWVGGDRVVEPRSGLETKILQLTREDGDVSNASRIWLDFTFSPDTKNWDSLEGYSEDFHDVLVLGNSVTFEPGEATALFELPVVAGSQAEGEEWVDVVVRPEYPSHYSDIPLDSLRLTIIDAL